MLPLDGYTVIDLSVGIAHHVGTGDVGPRPVLGAHVAALGPVVDRVADQFDGKDTGLNDGPLVVDVVDEPVQRPQVARAQAVEAHAEPL